MKMLCVCGCVLGGQRAEGQLWQEGVRKFELTRNDGCLFGRLVCRQSTLDELEAQGSKMDAILHRTCMLS